MGLLIVSRWQSAFMLRQAGARPSGRQLITRLINEPPTRLRHDGNEICKLLHPAACVFSVRESLSDMCVCLVTCQGAAPEHLQSVHLCGRLLRGGFVAAVALEVFRRGRVNPILCEFIFNTSFLQVRVPD